MTGSGYREMQRALHSVKYFPTSMIPRVIFSSFPSFPLYLWKQGKAQMKDTTDIYGMCHSKDRKEWGSFLLP